MKKERSDPRSRVFAQRHLQTAASQIKRKLATDFAQLLTPNINIAALRYHSAHTLRVFLRSEVEYSLHNGNTQSEYDNDTSSRVKIIFPSDRKRHFYDNEMLFKSAIEEVVYQTSILMPSDSSHQDKYLKQYCQSRPKMATSSDGSSAAEMAKIFFQDWTGDSENALDSYRDGTFIRNILCKCHPAHEGRVSVGIVFHGHSRHIKLVPLKLIVFAMQAYDFSTPDVTCLCSSLINNAVYDIPKMDIINNVLKGKNSCEEKRPLHRIKTKKSNELIKNSEFLDPGAEVYSQEHSEDLSEDSQPNWKNVDKYRHGFCGSGLDLDGGGAGLMPKSRHKSVGRYEETRRQKPAICSRRVSLLARVDRCNEAGRCAKAYRRRPARYSQCSSSMASVGRRKDEGCPINSSGVKCRCGANGDGEKAKPRSKVETAIVEQVLDQNMNADTEPDPEPDPDFPTESEFDIEEPSDDEDPTDEEDEYQRKTAKITSTIEFIDSFLIIWHAAFLILFLFLLSGGVVLRVYSSTLIERSVKSSKSYVLYSHFVKMENVPEELRFGELTNVLGESLIVLSALYIACVLCYMTFLLHRITFTIPIVVVISGAVVLIEINIINIYMSPVSAANEEAKKKLKAKAEQEYAVDSDNEFSVTYDIISIWAQCCGIVDQYDFQNVILKYFLPTKKEQKILQVPPTCCTTGHFEKGVEEVVECASTTDGIYSTGCYTKIYNWLRVWCNWFSIVVVLQLLDLCMHTVLYKKHLSLLTVRER